MSPSPLEPSRKPLLALLLTAGVVVSCTVFNDKVVPGTEPLEGGATSAGGGGSSSDTGTGAAPGGAGSSGGEAGAGGQSVVHAFMALDDAIQVCARVAECEMLADSIRASVGVPVKGATFSHCVHWLAGPLPPSHIVTPGQKAMFAGMAAATSCPSVLSFAYVEKIKAGDARCAAGQRGCSGSDEVLDCRSARLQIERCGSPLLGELTCSASSNACSPGFSFFGTECHPYGLRYSGDGIEQRAGCRERGLECYEAAVDYCGTEGNQEDCDTVGEVLCTNGVARVCADAIGTLPNMKYSPFDCIEIGAACSDEGGHLRCERADADCDVEATGACDADGNLEMCVGGKKVTRKCSELGLTCGGSPAGCQVTW